MWSLVLPYFISRDYNIVLFSQRGHGESSLPTATADPTTIPSLASDLQVIISSHLNIPSNNIKAIIGVSCFVTRHLAHLKVIKLLGENESNSLMEINCA